MRLAVKGMGQKYADGYIDVAAVGKLADNCAEYLHKGSQVAVDGRLEHSEWGDAHQRRQAHSVIAQDVTFLDRKPANGDSSTGPDENPEAVNPSAEDDIDF
jgi:single-strand DNA-binding protein